MYNHAFPPMLSTFAQLAKREEASARHEWQLQRSAESARGRADEATEEHVSRLLPVSQKRIREKHLAVSKAQNDQLASELDKMDLTRKIALENVYKKSLALEHGDLMLNPGRPSTATVTVRELPRVSVKRGSVELPTVNIFAAPSPKYHGTAGRGSPDSVTVVNI